MMYGTALASFAVKTMTNSIIFFAFKETNIHVVSFQKHFSAALIYIAM